MISFVFVFVLLCDFAPTLGKEFSLHFVNNSKYPYAICNDGSPSGFYLSSSTSPSPSSNYYLIFLEGGGWCYDEPTCIARMSTSNNLTSSLNWAQNRSVGGFFDSTSIEFMKTATHVYVPYCSSDGHMGNFGYNENINFTMNGKQIVEAVFHTLEEIFSLNDPNSTVLFGGTSAGARGAMVHLDHVASNLLPRAKVMGYLDSPMWVDVDPPSFSDKIGLKAQTVLNWNFANFTTYDRDNNCNAVYNVASGENWKCFFGDYRLPLVRTSNLLVSASYDSFNIGEDLDGGVSNEDEKAFSDSVAGAIIGLFDKIQSNGRKYAFHSICCFMHAGSVNKEVFSNITTREGVTQEMSLKRFLEGGGEGGGEDGDSFANVDVCRSGFDSCTISEECDSSRRLQS